MYISYSPSLPVYPAQRSHCVSLKYFCHFTAEQHITNSIKKQGSEKLDLREESPAEGKQQKKSRTREGNTHHNDLDKPSQSVGLSKMESFPEKTVKLDKVRDKLRLLSQGSAGLSQSCRSHRGMLFHRFPKRLCLSCTESYVPWLN